MRYRTTVTMPQQVVLNQSCGCEVFRSSEEEQEPYQQSRLPPKEAENNNNVLKTESETNNNEGTAITVAESIYVNKNNISINENEAQHVIQESKIPSIEILEDCESDYESLLSVSSEEPSGVASGTSTHLEHPKALEEEERDSILSRNDEDDQHSISDEDVEQLIENGEECLIEEILQTEDLNKNKKSFQQNLLYSVVDHSLGKETPCCCTGQEQEAHQYVKASFEGNLEQHTEYLEDAQDRLEQLVETDAKLVLTEDAIVSKNQRLPGVVQQVEESFKKKIVCQRISASWEEVTSQTEHCSASYQKNQNRTSDVPAISVDGSWKEPSKEVTRLLHNQCFEEVYCQPTEEVNAALAVQSTVESVNELSHFLSEEAPKLLVEESIKEISHETTEQVDEILTGGSIEKISHELVEQVAKVLVGDSNEKLSHEFVEEVTEVLVGDSIEETPHEIVEEVGEALADETLKTVPHSHEAVEKVTDLADGYIKYIIHESTEKAAQLLVEKSSKEISHESNEKVAEEVFHELTETVSENSIKQVYHNLTGELAEALGNGSLEDLPHESFEQVPESLTEKAVKEASSVSAEEGVETLETSHGSSENVAELLTEEFIKEEFYEEDIEITKTLTDESIKRVSLKSTEKIPVRSIQELSHESLETEERTKKSDKAVLEGSIEKVPEELLEELTKESVDKATEDPLNRVLTESAENVPKNLSKEPFKVTVEGLFTKETLQSLKELENDSIKEEPVKESEELTEQSVRESEALTEELVKESEALTEESVKESEELTEQSVKESEALTEESAKESEALTEESVKESEALTEESVKEAESLIEESIEEINERIDADEKLCLQEYSTFLETLSECGLPERLEKQINTAAHLENLKQEQEALLYGCELNLRNSTQLKQSRKLVEGEAGYQAKLLYNHLIKATSKSEEFVKKGYKDVSAVAYENNYQQRPEGACQDIPLNPSQYFLPRTYLTKAELERFQQELNAVSEESLPRYPAGNRPNSKLGKEKRKICIRTPLVHQFIPHHAAMPSRENPILVCIPPDDSVEDKFLSAVNIHPDQISKPISEALEKMGDAYLSSVKEEMVQHLKRPANYDSKALSKYGSSRYMKGQYVEKRRTHTRHRRRVVQEKCESEQEIIQEKEKNKALLDFSFSKDNQETPPSAISSNDAERANCMVEKSDSRPRSVETEKCDLDLNQEDSLQNKEEDDGWIHVTAILDASPRTSLSPTSSFSSPLSTCSSPGDEVEYTSRHQSPLIKTINSKNSKRHKRPKSLLYSSSFKNNDWQPTLNDKYTSGEFEVFNMDSALPDIEAQLNECKRRCDREEIRRRLAMGPSIEEEEDKPNRRQRLHSRLHSGMNLQICFMNEAGSDSDDDSLSSIHTKSLPPGLEDGRPATLQVTSTKQLSEQPQSLTLQDQKMDENLNFFTRQTQLQTEARLALVQAKEMAHMQMDIERQKRKKSPIADKVSDVVKQKVGPQIAGARRLTRPLLTKLNVAHLQLIVNDLHSQIEALNEELVGLLMKRDDLHMEQDSMLVDIEDLSKYLAAKEQDVHSNRKSDCSPLLKPKMRLLRSLVRK